jgi:hypothetical protein
MTYGYYYICDNCDKHERMDEEVKNVGTGTYATQYRSWKYPHQWFYLRTEQYVSSQLTDISHQFCSKNCVKEYMTKNPEVKVNK